MHRSVTNRWLQLGCWLICMIAMFTPQRGGMLFAGSAGAPLAWGSAALMLVALLLTWRLSVQAFRTGRFGPNRLARSWGAVRAWRATASVALLIGAVLTAGVLLPAQALAQAQAQAPAAAPAAEGQGGGPSAVWLLLLLLLVVVVVLFLMLRSGRGAQPAVKKGEAARGWFDPAGRIRNKY